MSADSTKTARPVLRSRGAASEGARAPQRSRTWPTVVDLFCGCGGVTAALKARHFRVVAAVDSDPVACQSYRDNHRRVHLYEMGIAAVDPRAIRRLDLDGRDLDLLVVCSPCQPFSQQNRKTRKSAAVEEDERAQLILTATRFAEDLAPRLIFFENVPGLTRKRFRPILTKLRDELTRLGYTLGDSQSLDAADYGVPQRRRRCVLLARKGAPPPALPSPITPAGKRRTVEDAIGDLAALTSGEASDEDHLHFARDHRPVVIERLRHIPKNGGSREALPDRLTLECHRDRRSYPDVYGRMRWDDVAPTLTTGCTDVTRGRFAHPEADRAITLREAARLQTFPDAYRFAGSAKHVAVQVGNAVPVRFIDALAATLRAGIAHPAVVAPRAVTLKRARRTRPAKVD